jgi:hypothetical protein
LAHMPRLSGGVSPGRSQICSWSITR